MNWLNTYPHRIYASVLLLNGQIKDYKIGENYWKSPYEVTIRGQEVKTPNQILYPSNDHRILMALSILGTKVKECEIEDIKCVNKSYPNFFKDLILIH